MQFIGHQLWQLALMVRFSRLLVKASHKDDSLIKVALRRSLDDGQTWETEQIIADGGDNVSASIACPVVIPASGSFSKERIMVLFLKNELVDKDARNGGRGPIKLCLEITEKLGEKKKTN